MNEEHRDLLERCRRDIIRLIVDAKCLDDILDELGKKDENGDYGLTRDNIARIKVSKSIFTCNNVEIDFFVCENFIVF